MVLLSEEDSENPGSPKYKPEDPTDVADWAAVINNAAPGMKQLFGQGNRSRAAANNIKFSGLHLPLAKQRQVDFTVMSPDKPTQEFLRSLQYGANLFLWYVTAGNILYGANDIAAAGEGFYNEGIPCSVLLAEDEQAIGDNSFDNWLLNFAWDALISPPRIVNSPLIITT